MTEPGRASTAAGRTALRADARRNRERILEAADAVFAENGPTASTEEVAGLAGVAIGTVFRHFPTKESLIEAVVVGRLERLVAEAERLADAVDADAAFTTFFRRWIELSASKHQFATALAHSGVDVQRIRSTHPEVARELHDAVAGLLGRAQRAGAIRPDLTASDVVALMVGASRAHEHVGPDRDRRAHLLSVTIDGLRPARAGAGRTPPTPGP